MTLVIPLKSKSLTLSHFYLKPLAFSPWLLQMFGNIREFFFRHFCCYFVPRSGNIPWLSIWALCTFNEDWDAHAFHVNAQKRWYEAEGGVGSEHKWSILKASGRKTFFIYIKYQWIQSVNFYLNQKRAADVGWGQEMQCRGPCSKPY